MNDPGFTAGFCIEVNGRPAQVDRPARTPLLQVLREDLGLRGAKLGCGQGECGACSVVIDGVLMCSCITPIVRCEGASITTVEGLSNSDDLHPIQQAFIDHGALQCGFCTPGMLMASYALLQVNPDPTENDVVNALTGNICRCTGYRKIIEAVLDAASRMKQ